MISTMLEKRFLGNTGKSVIDDASGVMIENLISGNCFFQSVNQSDINLYDLILKYHGALHESTLAPTSCARINAC